jgi:hypothetical protein
MCNYRPHTHDRTIHNDTIHLDRQIDKAHAIVDALDHEWEILQEYMAARREDADAIEKICRLTEDIAMTGGRHTRSLRKNRRTHSKRKHTKHTKRTKRSKQTKRSKCKNTK